MGQIDSYFSLIKSDMFMIITLDPQRTNHLFAV